MSLRYRLFLWILVTFCVAAVVDYVLESYTTSKKLAENQAKLKTKILEISEERREHVERFLATVISESQARIDVLLNRMTNYFSQVEHYAPIEENLVRGTWAATATLLAKNKWVDFIQNTNEGKLSSLIIPHTSSSLDNSYRIPINDDLSWVVMSDELKQKMPLLGIRMVITYQPSLSQAQGEQIILPQENTFDGEILFDVKDLISSPTTESVIGENDVLIVPWIEGYQIDVSTFYAAFNKARKYVQEGFGKPSAIEEKAIQKWIEEQIALQGKTLNEVQIPLLANSSTSPQFMQERLSDMITNYQQVYMIWTIAAFFQTGIFGNDLFSPPAPRGLSVYKHTETQGIGIHTTDAFYPKPVFEDNKYFNSHPPSQKSFNLGNSIAVFRGPGRHVYLGNTAQLRVQNKGQEKIGYLSLAIDGDNILQKLVEAVGEVAMIIHDGDVFDAYTQDGQRIEWDVKKPPPLSEMLANKTGIVEWENNSYFFSHMIPFPGIDLHFIMLNPVSEEFAFTKFLVEGVTRVVNSILLNIHIIGLSVMVLVLILLHNIARRITRPVTQLALATKEIGAGHFDAAEIPHPHSTGHGDEVAILCESFEQMVKGLKEKEKVQGVLNKVVSQEIAEEILKGNIRLGGEEKKVTVLFADIRNFTNMTQNMEPKAVIDFLNTCMTKISYIIDTHGGVIDKYVGDATMALFGAPVSREDSAIQAIKSALAVLDKIRHWNEERAQLNQHPVEMGIGIHTGNVLAGNMGAENRLNYTVIGRNVNLASRLCSSAQEMEIRISLDTLNELHVRESVIVEDLGPTILKGFDEPVQVFRVKGLR